MSMGPIPLAVGLALVATASFADLRNSAALCLDYSLTMQERLAALEKLGWTQSSDSTSRTEWMTTSTYLFAAVGKSEEEQRKLFAIAKLMAETADGSNISLFQPGNRSKRGGTIIALRQTDDEFSCGIVDMQPNRALIKELYPTINGSNNAGVWTLSHSSDEFELNAVEWDKGSSRVVQQIFAASMIKSNRKVPQ